MTDKTKHGGTPGMMFAKSKNTNKDVTICMRAARALDAVKKSKSNKFACNQVSVDQLKGRKCEPGMAKMCQPKLTALTTEENNATAGYETIRPLLEH